MLLYACLACRAEAADPAVTTRPDAVAETFLFDIAARPLGLALQDYAALTRYPALYRSEMVADRISNPVRGRYSAARALQLMLSGTGLQVEEFQSGSARGFVLKNAPGPQPVAATAAYINWLQARIWSALCGHQASAPGAYRVLLRFRIDDAGRLRAPRLLTSSGQETRDRTMLATLQALQLNILPPSSMPQPVTLLIVTDEAQAGGQCDRTEGAAP
ncbi:hypothetical protein [Herbaspirillum sp. alder98]|uniref:hypothetical protein n=1 Tax=Herbaspirillum sp. alder98 TaxID=2913096 RepID=UPI001CD91037|nr:hypothetical protein [Herbaspirillum sp. alder98]MCA1325576.1 hypothetical protein [Herbaspirillum sp. alder98]